MMASLYVSEGATRPPPEGSYRPTKNRAGPAGTAVRRPRFDERQGPGATSGSKHVKKGTTTGTGSGSARSNKGMSANPSSEGNVGPGTNNNMGKQPGGR